MPKFVPHRSSVLKTPRSSRRGAYLAALGAVLVGVFALTGWPGAPIHAAPGSPAPAGKPLKASDRAAARAEIERAARERKALEAERKAALAAAAQTERDLRAVSNDLIALGIETRRQEDIAQRAETRIRELDTEAHSLAATLRADEQALDDMLASLMVLSARRPPALILDRDAPRDSLRAALLMGEIAPVLRDRSRQIGADLKRLGELRRAAEGERDTLRASEANLDARRTEVEALVSEKRARLAEQQQTLSRVDAELAELAREVANLNDLLARLPERSKPAARRPGKSDSAPMASRQPDGEQFASAAPSGGGSFRLGAPTAGRLIRGYNARLEMGRQSFGHIYQTRARAQITTPAQGAVAFAGTLPSVPSAGYVVIIEAISGEKLVFTGLGEIFVRANDTVEAGEPLGEMPTRSEPEPLLYFEVRNGDTPINPTPWLNRLKAP